MSSSMLQTRSPSKLRNLVSTASTFTLKDPANAKASTESQATKQHNRTRGHRTRPITGQTSEKPARNQNLINSASESGANKPQKQFEANYDLIHALTSSLNKHLKRQDVIDDKSKELTIKCLDEIIRICAICLKREAKLKDATSMSLSGVSFENSAIRLETAYISDRVPADKITKQSTKAINEHSSLSLASSSKETKSQNVAQEACCETRAEDGGPVDLRSKKLCGKIVLCPATPSPVGTGLNTWFEGLNDQKLTAPERNRQNETSATLRPTLSDLQASATQDSTSNLKVFLANVLHSVYLYNATVYKYLKAHGISKLTSSQEFEYERPVPKARHESRYTSATNTNSHYSTVMQLQQSMPLPLPSITGIERQDALVIHRDNHGGDSSILPRKALHVWEAKSLSTNIDLYKPEVMHFPDKKQFPFWSSPVYFSRNTLGQPKGITSVWRHLSVLNSEELFHWYQVFEDVLEMTLSCLSKEREGVRDSGEVDSEIWLSRSDASLSSVEDSYYWKNISFSASCFIKTMRSCYLQRYGEPRFLRDERELIQFLNTRDTICSMVSEPLEIDVRLRDGSNAPAYQSSVGISSTDETLDIRRFTVHLTINSSALGAKIGEQYKVKPKLWDPHHTYSEIEEHTTYTLNPQIPWLKWNPDRKAFMGTVPSDIRNYEHLTSEVWALDDVDHWCKGGFRVRIQAVNHVTLPQGVRYMRTIKGQFCVILSDVQAFREVPKEAADTMDPDNDEGKDYQGPCSRKIWDNDESDANGVNNASKERQSNNIDRCSLENNDRMDVSDEERKVERSGVCRDVKKKPTTTNIRALTTPLRTQDDEPPTDMLPSEQHGIMDGLQSTLQMSQSEVGPKYPSWTRQRPYIEKQVTNRGMRMMGLFGSQKGDESESSETELSDGESQYLKHIPFVKAYRKGAQPAMKPVEGGSGLNIPEARKQALSGTKKTSTPVLTPVKPDYNAMNVLKKDFVKAAETTRQKMDYPLDEESRQNKLQNKIDSFQVHNSYSETPYHLSQPASPTWSMQRHFTPVTTTMRVKDSVARNLEATRPSIDCVSPRLSSVRDLQLSIHYAGTSEQGYQDICVVESELVHRKKGKGGGTSSVRKCKYFANCRELGQEDKRQVDKADYHIRNRQSLVGATKWSLLMANGFQ
ncbi:hypothetical protein BDZ91DRAFT_798756 [Kalaharituber pfeilii]|nr:hypothetical protein BDZ91DRAFT_798756 [Kalaharituber pfeilii]